MAFAPRRGIAPSVFHNVPCIEVEAVLKSTTAEQVATCNRRARYFASDRAAWSQRQAPYALQSSLRISGEQEYVPPPMERQVSLVRASRLLQYLDEPLG